MIVFNRLLIAWKLVCRRWKLNEGGGGEERSLAFPIKIPPIVNFELLLLLLSPFRIFERMSRKIGRVERYFIYIYIFDETCPRVLDIPLARSCYVFRGGIALSPPDKVHPINLNFYSPARETFFIFRQLSPLIYEKEKKKEGGKKGKKERDSSAWAETMERVEFREGSAQLLFQP